MSNTSQQRALRREIRDYLREHLAIDAYVTYGGWVEIKLTLENEVIAKHELLSTRDIVQAGSDNSFDGY